MSEVIGFSAYNRSDDHFVFEGEACYVADDEDAMRKALAAVSLSSARHTIKPVTMGAILADFGSSMWEYALESEAMERFEQIAKSLNVEFKTEPSEIRPDSANRRCIVRIDTFGGL